MVNTTENTLRERVVMSNIEKQQQSSECDTSVEEIHAEGKTK